MNQRLLKIPKSKWSPEIQQDLFAFYGKTMSSVKCDVDENIIYQLPNNAAIYSCFREYIFDIKETIQ